MMMHMIRHAARRSGLALIVMASLPGAAFAAQEEDGAPDDEIIDEITVLGERVAGDPPLGFSLDEEALARMPGTQNDPISHSSGCVDE
jgi:hypothetical protein